jgi:protein-tyrosine phosphatase
MANAPTRILFVCLGNICRSPLAEGVFQNLVDARGLTTHYRIDSAGTGGWHVGASPDERSIAVAKKNGVALTSRARQVEPSDFDDFDHIVAMDRQNLLDLRALGLSAAGGAARLYLLREFDPEPGDRQVPDPYYDAVDGFDRVYEMVRRSCEGLLDALEAERAGADEPDA